MRATHVHVRTPAMWVLDPMVRGATAAETPRMGLGDTGPGRMGPDGTDRCGDAGPVPLDEPVPVDQKGTTPPVDVMRSTIPGVGHAHDLRTRGGQRFGVVVGHDGGRRLLTYGSEDTSAPAAEILLDADEADQLADLLHQRSVADRLATLERRVAELAGSPVSGRIDA